MEALLLLSTEMRSIEMKTEKKALLGGSFDPVHMGHINLFHNISNLTDITTLYVVPAYVSAFKVGHQSATFDDTMAMVERVGFAAAYTFQYSPRTGTRAAAMENQIPAEVKSERLQRLNELQTRMTEQNNRKYINATGEVLVEGAGQRDGSDIAFGKLSNFKMVYFPGDAHLIGRYAEVCVQSIKGNSLFGVLKEEMK